MTDLTNVGSVNMGLEIALRAIEQAARADGGWMTRAALEADTQYEPFDHQLFNHLLAHLVYLGAFEVRKDGGRNLYCINE